MIINVTAKDFPGAQWLRLHASSARGTGSIPGQRTKIPHAVRPKKYIPKKE